MADKQLHSIQRLLSTYDLNGATLTVQWDEPFKAYMLQLSKVTDTPLDIAVTLDRLILELQIMSRQVWHDHAKQQKLQGIHDRRNQMVTAATITLGLGTRHATTAAAARLTRARIPFAVKHDDTLGQRYGSDFTFDADLYDQRKDDIADAFGTIPEGLDLLVLSPQAHT